MIPPPLASAQLAVAIVYRVEAIRTEHRKEKGSGDRSSVLIT